MKEANLDNITQWVQENKKFSCTNCQHKDFTLGNQFGIIDLIDFNSPQEMSQQKRTIHMRLIVVLCKNCGKVELYDAYTAGFLERVN